MTTTKVRFRTFSPRPRDIERRWYVVDAQDAVLGRLASEVAKILRGKHKPIFAPHADTGDHVIVVNARGVRLTGAKESQKLHYRHSGYPGGLRATSYARLLADRPALAVEKAVRGMLPKNRLGRQIATKLAVYDGPDHPHRAQKPSPLALGAIPRWEGLPAPKPGPALSPRPAAPAKAEAAAPARAERGGRKGPAKARSAPGSRSKAASASGSRSKARPGTGSSAKATKAKKATKATARPSRQATKGENDQKSEE